MLPQPRHRLAVIKTKPGNSWRGLTMGAVMIRCPRTGGAVSTEIETEPEDFKRLPRVVARLHCPLCGEDHNWIASEAWLDEPTLVPKPEPEGGS
jgi:hypothetical protein